jgi:hypothetical protein
VRNGPAGGLGAPSTKIFGAARVFDDKRKRANFIF